MNIEVSQGPHDNHLAITTHNAYAMDIGIQILKFLNTQDDIEVKNNGWQNGFGIEVAVWHPIISHKDLVIGIQTDGACFEFKRVSGTRADFNSVMALVVGYLDQACT